MKIEPRWWLLAGVATLALLLQTCVQRFEVIMAPSNPIVFRVDHWTGRVDWSAPMGEVWKPIPER